MLRLMPRAVLLGREPALARLRTALHSAEQTLRVPFVMLSQVAAAVEARFGAAAGEAAAPGAVVGVLDAPALHLACSGRDAAGGVGVRV